MAYSKGSLVDDYMQLRTVPALIGIVFAISSLYQFGGIANVSLEWINYTLTTQDSMLISLGAYAVAFASSETKQFQHYEDWEKGMIAAAPVLIVGHEYLTFVSDFVTNNSPTGGALLFILCMAAWGVAVR